MVLQAIRILLRRARLIKGIKKYDKNKTYAVEILPHSFPFLLLYFILGYSHFAVIQDNHYYKFARKPGALARKIFKPDSIKDKVFYEIPRRTTLDFKVGAKYSRTKNNCIQLVGAENIHE